MLAPQLVFTLLIAGCLRLLLAGRLVVVVFAVPGRVLAALLDTADTQGHTPLHVSSRAGYKEVVELLLSAGCDPYARDAQGRLAYDLVEVTSCPTRMPECGNTSCSLHSAKAAVKEMLEEYL